MKLSIAVALLFGIIGTLSAKTPTRRPTPYPTRYPTTQAPTRAYLPATAPFNITKLSEQEVASITASETEFKASINVDTEEALVEQDSIPLYAAAPLETICCVNVEKVYKNADAGTVDLDMSLAVYYTKRDAVNNVLRGDVDDFKGEMQERIRDYLYEKTNITSSAEFSVYADGVYVEKDGCNAFTIFITAIIVMIATIF
mmetsp:Transcript_6398/g.5631  ORF Transcript_6398/g.5631 Transcript_6398/m.5631 type:complete len:200 (+) Transcript_6398:135-734(+)|eukprot:CAMPEP_0201564222 /NCGR_PEP_ID=MMETSP0190_2-20130828/2280_1 /ASSEMBLY_ACC=CAM_ASM_000263 /TAXON_ID=37353 /ORGANISM="Rosalina sp." /LENGTH=199 /DNA_ID=CAMNT_0047980087 /DNA_START=125 /DNA_END=724 /DNA_ORIENTATION=-